MTATAIEAAPGRRVTYRGRLRFPYGFHTGDGRRLDLADQPLFREADGRIALAGTSLAGALRADLRRLAAAAGRGCTGQRDCACPLCRLMGPEPPEERGPEREDKSLRASRLYVSGGSSDRAPDVRIRDHVGIDRRTRTAADRRKYDVEVAEAGLELPFELRIDDSDEHDASLLESALGRLADGWWFLGGKTAAGLGRVELIELTRHETDLATPRTLVEYLLADEPIAVGASTTLVPEAGGGRWAAEWSVPPVAPQVSEWAQLRFHLELDFPFGLLVNAPAEALFEGADHAFARLPDGRPFLPGSALRGALRSRAEQILRTLGGDAAACDLNRKGQACHERIDQESERSGEALDFDAELERHCLGCRVFGSGRLASGVKITDLLPVGEVGEKRTQELVAVDRFTGGVAEGAKFDAQLSGRVTVRGEIHLEIGRDRLRPWSLGLLALVVRDLLAGDVPIGFGSAKGLNEYRARIAGVGRFWLRPPQALATAGGEEGSGTRRWAASAVTDWADPRIAREAASEILATRLVEWVDALHEELKRSQATPSGEAEPSRPPDGEDDDGAAGETAGLEEEGR